MKNDFIIAITQLSAEKNLPKEVVLEAVEAALASAFKKELANVGSNITVKVHPTTGELLVQAHKLVVEEVTDPKAEMTVAEARELMPKAVVGDTVSWETTPQNAGRIAAQTAKQVVMQRLREAEREIVFAEFVGREGDIVSGTITRIEPKQIVIDLGKTEAVLPATEQVRAEHYRIGQRIKAYVLEVFRASRGPQVMVSRTHRHLVRRLFELEVPEIFNGTVEIKAISREPGIRSKVAVAARQEGVDAVGSCIGLRGIRIQNIMNELSGEKIDVIEWHPDAAQFVANALSPAPVVSASVDEEAKTATVVVPDRQLSLAIGREGQNARLAAKLTGWRIDIKSATVAEAERVAHAAEMGIDLTVAAQPAAAVQAPVTAAPAQAAPAAVAPETVEVRPAAVAPVERPLSPEELALLELEEEEEEAAAAAPVAEAPAPPPAAPVAPPAPVVPDRTLILGRSPVAPAAGGLRFAEDIFGDRGGKGRRGRGRGREEEVEGVAKAPVAKKAKRSRPGEFEAEPEDEAGAETEDFSGLIPAPRR
jgi:N utilization substance protein A